MSRPHILALSSGGLRSLVAAALVARETPAPRLTLLHIVDGRENQPARRRHLHLQADWLGCKAVAELSLPHLYPKDATRDAEGQPVGHLVRPQVILAALAKARAMEVRRVLYPGSSPSDPDTQVTTTTLAEQIQLCEHLAMAEPAPAPTLEAPLLELTDAQIIQVGEQLSVPWHAAWSCQLNSNVPCRACRGCHRRRKAFEATHIIDTQRAALAGR